MLALCLPLCSFIAVFLVYLNPTWTSNTTSQNHRLCNKTSNLNIAEDEELIPSQGYVVTGYSELVALREEVRGCG